jgi:transposase
MSYLRGSDRSQGQLLPPCVEDYVPSHAAVRFIDAFVEGLDLKALAFTHSEAAGTGRPPYHPADLLKLYVYGYMNRIRSSRRLEAEAGRNLELIWLLRGLRPDFKTIADFRKDNRRAFRGIFKQFNLLCRAMGLFGAELVAIDGSKFKALNSPQRHYHQEQVRELVQQVEQRIEEYLGELDRQDEELSGVGGPPGREELTQKIAQLKERQARYTELLAGMEASGQSEVSLSDADSRGMKKVGVGYNVQVAVDAKHHLIVAQEVTQAANDLGQLATMAEAAKTALGVEELQVVADTGYHEAQQIERCEQQGVETYVSASAGTAGQSRDEQQVFPKGQFHYDAQNDTYQCPAGQRLSRAYAGKSRGKDRIYYYNPAACAGCVLKAQCTTSRYRKISRLVNEGVLERQAQRVRERPELIRKRWEIIEHCFGTIKEWGFRSFSVKGLEPVSGEFSLMALAYNLKRALSVAGLSPLLAQVRAAR